MRSGYLVLVKAAWGSVQGRIDEGLRAPSSRLSYSFPARSDKEHCKAPHPLLSFFIIQFYLKSHKSFLFLSSQIAIVIITTVRLRRKKTSISSARMEDCSLLSVRSGNMVSERKDPELLNETQENPCIIDDFFDNHVTHSEVSAISKVVLNAVEGDYGSDLQSVMSDLGLLNNKLDDEEIATALYNYRKSRHLLINDDTIMQMRAAEDDFKGGAFQKDGNTQDILTKIQTVGIPDCDETLEEFSRRHDKFCTSLSDTFFVYDGAQVQLSQERHGPRMDVGSLDNILGIAGFRPEKSLGLLPSKNLGNERKPKPEEFNMEDSKIEGLKELRDHVRVEKTKSGFCAEVSLKPVSSFATQDHNIDDIYHLLVTIISIYSRVAKVKEKLRSIGSLGHEIVYLKRRGAGTRRSIGLIDTGEADLHFTDGYIIETVSLNMETLDELFTTVDNFYDKFQKISERTKANRGWFWSAVSAALTVVSFVASFLGFPALIGVGLMALASNFTSGWGSATDDERMAAVSALGESAEPIMGRLQLPAVQNSLISPSMLQEDISTLHKIALTGQFLSLLFQSHIRGSSAPFDFEGLVDCPISHFRLRGTDANAPSIYAFSQKLACFPDQKVLIFDTADDNGPSAQQLQTTPAHMILLWQPINLIMHRKVIEPPSARRYISLIRENRMHGTQELPPVWVLQLWVESSSLMKLQGLAHACGAGRNFKSWMLRCFRDKKCWRLAFMTRFG
jgi:hypothetical protein